MFCPFISTSEKKLPPSGTNCANCCFYLYEYQSGAKCCAILLAAERASNAAEILSYVHKQELEARPL